ncbi:MAG: hypothetical protein AB7L65_04815 [Hyphomonadaceae bacterium]
MLVRRAFLAAFASAALPVAAWAGEQSGGGDASREQQRLTSAETYVPFPTLSAGVISQGRATGTMVVDVGVDVPDPDLRARARALGPRMFDALRTALSTFSTVYYRDRTAPDLDTLSRLMQTAVDRVMGRPGARLLLANVVYQRRTR